MAIICILTIGFNTKYRNELQVGQETCYNVPRLEPRKVKVDITLPEPVEKCQTR